MRRGRPHADGAGVVRDSKDPAAGLPLYGPEHGAAFIGGAAFLDGVKAGAFNG
ncbi:hypothetical protein [Streptomyces pratensis]|uniref:hypothetical protein n=1 Tax=Streptomyces pratensis TaxID=1169025 RepID=UPI00301AC802